MGRTFHGWSCLKSQAYWITPVFGACELPGTASRRGAKYRGRVDGESAPLVEEFDDLVKYGRSAGPGF